MRIDDLLVEQVGVEVVRLGAAAPREVGAIRAEVLRSLRFDRDVVVGDRADVVLRERESVPEAEVGPAVREDVRDPAGRVADLGGELARGRAVWPRRPPVGSEISVSRPGPANSSGESPRFCTGS